MKLNGIEVTFWTYIYVNVQCTNAMLSYQIITRTFKAV